MDHIDPSNRHLGGQTCAIGFSLRIYQMTLSYQGYDGPYYVDAMVSLIGDHKFMNIVYLIWAKKNPLCPPLVHEVPQYWFQKVLYT